MLQGLQVGLLNDIVLLVDEQSSGQGAHEGLLGQEPLEIARDT